jgi:hypothetical protein
MYLAVVFSLGGLEPWRLPLALWRLTLKIWSHGGSPVVELSLETWRLTLESCRLTRGQAGSP